MTPLDPDPDIVRSRTLKLMEADTGLTEAARQHRRQSDLVQTFVATIVNDVHKTERPERTNYSAATGPA